MRHSMAGAAAALAMAVVSQVALAPAASAQAGVTFLGEQKASEIMTNRLGGTRVFNAKGDVIGTINDVVLDDKGQAQSVVIGLGGFLGIGAKLVAVPYSAVKFGPVVESARVILLDVSKEQLEKAPAYKANDPGKTERAKQKASEWAKIAKDKAIELGKQAGTAIEGVREKMNAPAPKQ